MRILAKIGGAQLEEPDSRRTLCNAVRSARDAGHDVIVLHGGGNQIRTVSKALGLVDRYHEGLRITDARTADVVLMVLAGLVNRTLVGALQASGVGAVGLSGADAGLFSARRLTKAGVDLGFVGEVETVRPRVAETLLAASFVPVIATVAPAANAATGEPFFNLNADHAAGPLARALRCDAVLFLTDVPAVLDADRRPLAELTPAACARLVEAGIATGGMLPKLEAALAALRDNPKAIVKIAPGGAADAVLAALDAAIGTRFVATSAARPEEPHDG